VDAVLGVLGRHQIPREVILMDDGPGDKTAPIARSKGVGLLSDTATAGHMASLKLGLRRTRRGRALTTDADGTYPTGEVPRPLEHLGEYDMAMIGLLADLIDRQAAHRLDARPPRGERGAVPQAIR